MSKPKANKRRTRPRPLPAAARPADHRGTGKTPATAAAGNGQVKKPADRPGARKARRGQARNRAALIGVAVGVTAGVVVAVVSARQRHDGLLNRLTAGGCRVDAATDPGGEHVSAPTFRVDPPSGGDHLPSAASAGFYEPGQAPPDGAAVHSLQHGYVDIWYRPTLDPAALEPVRRLFDTYQKDTLVLPHPSLSQPIAATAWHHRLLCGSVDTAALTAFVKAYRNQGPEKVPHTR